MITADLHNHTYYSHGKNLVDDMYASAKAKGLAIYGFTEHSPRPEKFTYTREYRDHLNAHLHDYVSEVKALQKRSDGPRVLFGMEIDWFESDQEFVRKAATQFDFDYLIGSVHFIGTWGFDDRPEDWDMLSQPQKEDNYTRYFQTWKKMICTGLFNIAGHPDLVKIYSIDSFHQWLVKEESMRLIKDGLEALKSAGMAMEISSAGIRKVCREIYPCAPIMRMAADMGVSIAFASDAHNTDDVAYGFPRLASYARGFGYRDSVAFDENKRIVMPF